MQSTTPSRVILAVAPNGGRRGKSDHPAIPLTPDELAQDAAACLAAGASVLHLHVRDAAGRHSLSPELYADAIAAVRRAVGDALVIQITTEAVGRYAPEEQMAAVRAVRPEAVSLALRELAPGEADKAGFAAFMAWLQAEGIAPQIILYDRQDVDRLLQWAADGVLDAAATSALFVLGRYAEGQRSNPVDLLAFLGVGPVPFRDWMVCAFGPNEPRCAALAGLLGGHVRVGFENNLHRPDGRLAASNAELAGETARLLQALRLELASAAEVRSLWRIG
jgi:uncharacterized protein (DUF849 family)